VWGVAPAPHNVRAREASGGRHSLAPPEHGFQLGFESSLQASDVLLEELAGLSSQKISRAAALRVPAVLRARNVIAGVPATLPIELRDRKTREVDDRTWLGEDPNPDLEQTVMYAQTFEDLLFHSTAYWRVTRFSEGFPIECEHVDHRSVSQHQILGMPSQVISEDLQFTPRDPVFIDGYPVLNPREVIRFVSPNPPLLVHAAKAIRTALVLNETAERYANDPLPFGYFTDSEDQTDPLEDDEVEEILTDWEVARRKRVWGYISKGLSLQQLKWPTPEDLQLADARQHAVLELARATGLDPEDMGVSVTSRTYQNAEERRLNLIDFVLMVIISAVQDRLSKPDITPRHLRARFDLSEFVRADMKSRFEAHEISVRAGFRRAQEVRRAEGWPDFTDPERAEAEAATKRLVPGPRPAQLGVDPFDELTNGHRELAGVG
jgi:hypothetical protein